MGKGPAQLGLVTQLGLVQGKQNLRDACSKGKLEFNFSFYSDMKGKVSRKTTLLKPEKEESCGGRTLGCIF